MIFHKSVLLQQAVEVLNVQKGEKYIDGTAGAGGHSEEIIKKGGIVLGIDQDPDAIAYLKEKFKDEKNFTLAEGNFAEIDLLAKKKEFSSVSGIIFDLGVSSYQLDKSGRGFSFLRSESLDMRMNPKLTVKASDIINSWSKEELYELFLKMGEEHAALPITEHIIRARRVKPITDSLELAKVIEDVVPKSGKIHPATKSFLALRIAVNSELANLKTGIEKGFGLLSRKGRIAVISFHSLEDRIVKNEFRKMENMQKAKVVTKKPIVPDEREIDENPRSRSAKLRVIEKI